MGRTNINLDDDLLAETMAITGKSTKKAAVDEAMRRVVRNAKLKELIEGMRGIEWDDGLGAADRLPHAAEDGAPFDHEK